LKKWEEGFFPIYEKSNNDVPPFEKGGLGGISIEERDSKPHEK
jgi:hypothetical protein